MSARRELLAACALVLALVLARTFVYIRYEQAFFDSDQAIIGLMAKHLIEGRAFPLFYYGQTYMLGVDAWVSALAFLVAGPTVGALHAAIAAMNGVAAVLLVLGIVRSAKLRALTAAVPVLFFAIAPPQIARSLVEAGANIGPLVYVPLLWLLRGRALWFGVVLAIGVLNREFTIYALPVLVAGDVLTRRVWTRARLRHWLLVAVAFFAAWQTIETLKPYSDMMGPGTRGALVRGDAGSQVGNVGERVALAPADLPARLRAMAGAHLPLLFGGRQSDVLPTRTAHPWVFWMMAGLLCGCAIRALWLAGRDWGRAPHAAVGAYLAGVGALAAVVYVATRPADGLVVRYLLLTALMPVGVMAAYLALEPRRAWRVAVAAVVVGWAAVSVVDHATLLGHYARGLEPNETRDLVRGLDARGIHVAEAGYWRAYKVTFLARERVKIASTDVVRIDEYQRLAREAGPALVRISEEPCPGGEAVSVWYLCRGDR